MKRVQTAVVVVATLLVACFSSPLAAAELSLSDGNSIVRVDPSSQAGMLSWNVDGVNQLLQQWFWYRVGSGPENPINALPLVNATAAGSVLEVTYSDGNLEIEVLYFLSGGLPGTGNAQISETIRAINRGATPLDLHLFQYSDFDLNGDASDDTAVLISPNAVQQSDNISVFSESVFTPVPAHYEINTHPNILNALNDGIATTLGDIPALGVQVGPTNLTWALQWDRMMAPNDTFIISKIKSIQSATNPCDCVFSVVPAPPVTVACDGDTRTNSTGVPRILSTGTCEPVVSYSDATTPGNCPGNYTITRTWTVTPRCGDANTSVQLITVRDTAPPVIGAPGVNATINCLATPVFTPPTATDNCGTPQIMLVSDVTTPGNCVGAYSRTMTWKAVDVCGNASGEVSQTITVNDTTRPVITFVPSGGDLGCNPATLPTDASVTALVTATDNCGTPTVTVTHVDNGTACASNRTFTIVATDPCNNMASSTVIYTFGCSPCVPGTFTFSGSTDDKGAPNTRTFTANGVQVNVTAFSRIKDTDNWSPAYVGLFSKGLGVTDSSEDGDDPSHTVDNVDRDNFLLFEFSQPVIVDRAYLGFVESDSDMTIWVGNAADPFNNHLSLNNALLAGLQFSEENTGGSSARWADLNSGQIVGNVFVVAARVGDTRDQFKLHKLDFCKPDCGPPPPPICTPATVTFSGSSEESGPLNNSRMFVAPNGVTVKVTGFSRRKDTGVWNQGYVGLYSKGLGVTDSSEGDGGGDSHTTDNIGRDNFLLFEFSQPVVVNRAYLGYVVSDSDLNAWIGNVPDLFNTVLSDALLNGFGSFETNATDSSSTRWADLNSGQVTGNALVIAARLNDSGDRFKLNKLDICGPGAAQSGPDLPSPWNTKDIGSVDAEGGAGYSIGKFTVSGSGDYIWGTADEFRYVHQSADNSCSIVARVVKVQNTDPWAKAGVMIRESLSAGAKHASMFVFPNNGVQWQTRTSSGASSSDVITSGFKPPYWLKVVRSGNTFTGYASSDGSTWTSMGSRTISMSSTVYIGLGVTSHDDGTLCTAVFDNVTASP